MMTLAELDDLRDRRDRLKTLVCVCVLVLAVLVLASSGPSDVRIAGASTDADREFIVWHEADPANAAWFEWHLFMQDPANAAWFEWVTAPKVAALSATPAPYGVWDRLRECEAPDWSGGWSANTGNGFYGGLQFTLDSWRWVGGTGYPHQHSRETQIEMGERLLARQGWGAWPTCSRKLGLR